MDADTLRAEGDRLRDARAWARAAEAYAAHLALRPDARDIRVQLGHCRKEAGAVEEALDHYRAAEAALPDDADVAVQIGHALKLLGRTEDAAAAYGTALLRDPLRADAAAEIIALRDRLPVPRADVLVLGHADAALVAALPEAAFAAWDQDRFRWLPAGLAVHGVATGTEPPATPPPRLAQGARILLAGPLPAEAIAALAPLASACGARIALLAGPGWTARGLAVARLLASVEGAGDPAALVEAAGAALPLPPMPAPRLGHAVTFGTGPVPVPAPEHGLGLIAPRSGTWGAALPEGRPLLPGAAWLRLAKPDPGPLRLLVRIAAGAPCRIAAACGAAEATERLRPGEIALLSLSIAAGAGPLDIRLSADQEGALLLGLGMAREASVEERLAVQESLLFRRLSA
jgi:hypothetical protein